MATSGVWEVTPHSSCISRDLWEFLFIHLQQADFDMLLVNLRMDATYIKEGMNITCVAEVRSLSSTHNIISLHSVVTITDNTVTNNRHLGQIHRGELGSWHHCETTGKQIHKKAIGVSQKLYKASHPLSA